uniref:Uncharacterized protein n=1 Tax=Amphimedon queenslandica TaxID=400682 RepID=A0A1X7TF68_AMPQE
MKIQMQPSPDAIRRVEFCLVVPKNAELGDYARPGAPGIIFRGKVLLLFNLVRQSDQSQLLIPLLHDPKTNNNFVPKRPSPQISMYSVF